MRNNKSIRQVHSELYTSRYFGKENSTMVGMDPDYTKVMTTMTDVV